MLDLLHLYSSALALIVATEDPGNKFSNQLILRLMLFRRENSRMILALFWRASVHSESKECQPLDQLARELMSG
jgi:hypothetical protein